MYGRSEEVVGELTSAPGQRPRLFVATKVWTTGLSWRHRADGGVYAQVAGRTRSTPIPGAQSRRRRDTTRNAARMEARTGRVRYIGITHYNAGGHDAVARVLQSQAGRFCGRSIIRRANARRSAAFRRSRLSAALQSSQTMFAAGDLFRRPRSKPLPAWRHGN